MVIICMIIEPSIKNPFGIEFHVKKDRKVELLTDILDELGKEYTFAERTDGTYTFRIYGAEEVEEVEQYLDNKKILLGIS